MLKVKHRFDIIKDIVKGKKVLDIGCVGLGYQEEDEFWVHGKICKIAKTVIGVDIQEDKIENLRNRGYNTVVADINIYLDLGTTFDVINVGQILTYITNFDTFFDNVKKHLKPNGILILSVTNAHSLKNFIKYMLRKLDFQYTNFQNDISMTYLIDKYGFKIRCVEFIEEPSRRKIGKIYQCIFRALPRHLSSHVIIIASFKVPSSKIEKKGIVE